VAEQLSECLGALIQGVVWLHNLAKYLLCILYKQSELTSEALDCVSNPIRLNTNTMLFNELFNSNPEPLIEGVLDNSGQEHSPVASAIIRRILLQRTDLLSKYGPVKVGAAVDDVADFVGDTDEIGSSDVSGWVRQVEQMLGNMTEAGYKRDAYQRDYDNSVAGMSKRDSYAYSQDGGGNDERHDLDPTEWYIVKDGKMFKTSVYPSQEQQAISQGYSRSREEAKAKADRQGVAEGDEDRSRLIHFNTWTVMDSDEEVMRHSVERDPFFSAKKFMRQLDDEGYDFTHVISPEGKITYSPQHDPRHLRNFPEDDMAEGVAEGDIGQLEKDIAAAPVEPIANMEGSNEKIGNMDADAFDSAMARLKKLAGAGPMKTVWDPARRQYRNMPTAVQPPQQPKK
jgi:hypothetical protein